jgi:H+-translocating NAD(P) transhydrogenase subunit alpha
MDPIQLADKAAKLATEANRLAIEAAGLALDATRVVGQSAGGGLDPTTVGLTVFMLACFVGYYVVWNVTPALHSPLMAVTNAISSVIIVGALIAAGPAGISFAKVMGFLAVILASVNIFGGFIVTRRMLQMFKKKK